VRRLTLACASAGTSLDFSCPFVLLQRTSTVPIKRAGPSLLFLVRSFSPFRLVSSARSSFLFCAVFEAAAWSWIRALVCFRELIVGTVFPSQNLVFSTASVPARSWSSHRR
jgi:hypothetical protein